MSNGLKTPEIYVGKFFNPTVCTINNKITFVATSGHITKNKKLNGTCGLAPVCDLKWELGDGISRIYILENQPHKFSGTEVWGCQHHGLASTAGIFFQSQHVDRRITRSMGVEEGGQGRLNKEERLRKARVLKDELLKKLEDEKDITKAEELSKNIIT